MVTTVNLTGQNWLITPAVNPPEASFRPAIGITGGNPNQLWLLVLSGLGTVSFAGNGSTDWVLETVRIVPDVSAALASVSGSIVAENLAFNLVMWAPFASISSVTSDDYNINGGFAIYDWRPTPFIADLTDSSGAIVSQVFQGIDVDIAALSTSVIAGMSYNITLLGQIVSLPSLANA